ncbi:hypothetical protein [Desulforamulus aeronauticus]|uniref:20S proteasome, alpha and beta subunits n=1 Tax=Desulforamulus aeronauticus DSM 10349 TaxID=1121421 RepID=A0A1M6SBU8_9FIRM|nr:hypothetical protein [Desulforamulus aeronauticus]SHK42099.1 hypothetical protein SAMN02745123_01788 [Desulforamulus aeronauticus DSM 10349]
MTVVISYVSDSFSIIATDTRVIETAFGKVEQTDDNQKLYDLKNMGWCAGAGQGDFIEDFKRSLDNIDIPVSSEIRNLFNRTIENAYTKSPLFIEEIDNSVIAFSCFSIDENNLKVGFLCKKFLDHASAKDIDVLFFKNNTISIIYPSDYLDRPDMMESLEERYTLSFKTNQDKSKILNIITKIFEEICFNSSYVSRACDIGFQCYQPEGIYKTRLKDDISRIRKIAIDEYLKYLRQTK